MARKITIDQIAPDFTLNDFDGKPVSLSSFRGKKIVLLVFNRGFM
jgi:peroxiredoxin